MRVVLGEDLALLRDGLIRLLTANGFDVIEAVDNGPALLRALVEHKPDVAVVDVRLPPTFTDEGLRVAIEALEVPRVSSNGHLRVTASFGVASFPGSGADKHALIGRAHV